MPQFDDLSTGMVIFILTLILIACYFCYLKLNNKNTSIRRVLIKKYIILRRWFRNLKKEEKKNK